MLCRDIVSSGWLVGVLGLGLAAPGSVAAQAAAGSGQADGTYQVPRTPDGHPDLQGFWSNQTYTPLQRREGVAGAFYTPEELALLVSGAAGRESAQTEPGTIPDVHYDFTQFGLDRSQAARAENLRTSMIVDPPDGRLPPVNAAGERLAAERAEAQARLGGRWDSAESNQLDDRCIIMRGVGPPMMPSGYNANYHIVQSAGHVMILSEMIHDARIIRLDDPAAPPSGVRQWIGLSRGHWDGDHPGGGDHELQRQEPVRGVRRSDDGDRALHPGVRRRYRVPVHGRRSGDLGSRVDGREPDAEDPRPAVRVRVPRGQLRALQHARRRPVSKSGVPPRRRTSPGTGDMVMRTRLSTMTLAAVVALAAASAAGQTSEYRAPRAPDGNPDLNGIWQALSSAHWDVEPHSAGPSVVRELGALSAVPAGLGITGGDAIPYTPGGPGPAEREPRQPARARPRPSSATCRACRAACTWPFPVQIVQSQAHIMILHEFAGAVRTVYMENQMEAPADSWMGWSNGHWDGDTLVIDTTGFNGQTWFDQSGNFHSEALHVVERITPRSPDTLWYEVTLEDPNGLHAALGRCGCPSIDGWKRTRGFWSSGASSSWRI